MPPAYSTAQKNAVAQFVALTRADRTAAAKALRAANWNLQTALDNHWHSPGSASSDSPALEALYEKYRVKGGHADHMDMTATQKYFTDIGVDLEDVSCLIVLEIVKCKTIGEITKDGFVKGWIEQHWTMDTIAKQKAHICALRPVLGKPESAKILENVYRNTFDLLLQNPGQRTAEKETCVGMWNTLFSPPSLDWKTANVNWQEEWINFIEASSIKGINRDQWNHVLKLARLTLEDETLGFHSEEQSWPSVIDEFADFMKAKIKATKEGDAMEL